MEVTSQEAALAVLRQGIRNRQVCHTLLNSDSSRSHSVFTIKLHKTNGDVWSKFSICDLAGAERSKKTATTGRAMKEASNINTSLMKLGRCLEILRYLFMFSKSDEVWELGCIIWVSYGQCKGYCTIMGDITRIYHGFYHSD